MPINSRRGRSSRHHHPPLHRRFWQRGVCVTLMHPLARGRWQVNGCHCRLAPATCCSSGALRAEPLQQQQRQPCSICGRRFAPERIEQHQRVCSQRDKAASCAHKKVKLHATRTLDHCTLVDKACCMGDRLGSVLDACACHAVFSAPAAGGGTFSTCKSTLVTICDRDCALVAATPADCEMSKLECSCNALAVHVGPQGQDQSCGFGESNLQHGDGVM